MKKKIYIAGKVTGEPRGECTQKFKTAQTQLENRGFEPINPLEVVGTWKITWEEAMKKYIAALMGADAVFTLPCVNSSRGAKLELDLARKLGIPVCTTVDGFYQFLINETEVEFEEVKPE